MSLKRRIKIKLFIVRIGKIIIADGNSIPGKEISPTIPPHKINIFPPKKTDMQKFAVLKAVFIGAVLKMCFSFF
ncbi:MAG: hypothetical protein GX488_04395 [Clostridiales bacterium]|nr:hypothetical protein [Clostridiales bacterium]